MPKLNEYTSRQFDNLVEQWCRINCSIAAPLQIDEPRSPEMFTAIFECAEKDRSINYEWADTSYFNYSERQKQVDEIVAEARKTPQLLWNTRTEEERKNDPLVKLNAKLKEIDAKANCGTIRTLDKIANGVDTLADRTHNVASWLRKVTWKMPNVCAIKFKKE